MINVLDIRNGKRGEMNNSKKKEGNTNSMIGHIIVTDIDADVNKEFSCCRRCGKKLKKLEYRLIGYGPICYKKIKNSNSKRLFNIV